MEHRFNWVESGSFLAFSFYFGETRTSIFEVGRTQMVSIECRTRILEQQVVVLYSWI